MPESEVFAPAPAVEATATRRAPSLADTLTRLRYQWFPDHVVGEILAKPWVDNLAPFCFLVIVLAVFGTLIPDFFGAGSLITAARQLGEFGCIVLGSVVVMVGGGIDLSVGSTFALANITALICMNILGLPPAWPWH